jgi:LPXTG-site transpeptidase (sortase) family protein
VTGLLLVCACALLAVPDWSSPRSASQGLVAPLSRVADERQQATVAPARAEAPIALLTIPAIGLQRIPVYERGMDQRGRMQLTPGLSVAHFAPSARLGGASNAVLYGHDDIEGSVFGNLGKLQVGNGILVELPGGDRRVYRVDAGPRVIAATATDILLQTSMPRLTLFTCYPTWIDDRRLVVTASPVT